MRTKTQFDRCFLDEKIKRKSPWCGCIKYSSEFCKQHCDEKPSERGALKLKLKCIVQCSTLKVKEILYLLPLITWCRKSETASWRCRTCCSAAWSSTKWKTSSALTKLRCCSKYAPSWLLLVILPKHRDFVEAKTTFDDRVSCFCKDIMYVPTTSPRLRKSMHEVFTVVTQGVITCRKKSHSGSGPSIM